MLQQLVSTLSECAMLLLLTVSLDPESARGATALPVDRKLARGGVDTIRDTQRSLWRVQEIELAPMEDRQAAALIVALAP